MSQDESNLKQEPGANDNEQSPDELKREFIRRFGSYAVTAPAAVYLLMSPRTSKAVGSDGAPF